MDGQVTDVKGQEDEALQLGQIVVAKLQVEDDGTLALQRAHRLGDVRQIGGLAQDVQPVLLHRADAGRDLALLRTHLSLRWTLAEHLVHHKHLQQEHHRHDHRASRLQLNSRHAEHLLVAYDFVGATVRLGEGFLIPRQKASLS